MSAPSPVIPEAPRAVPVAQIERELDALWKAAAAGVDPEHPVFRACMSNLLVYCRTDQEAGTITAELPEVLALHPARAFVLVADEQAETVPLDAYVSAHCHIREGTKVCGESVTLTGQGAAVRRMPATIRALLIGDLPTTLWWATPAAPVLAGALYADLAGMANQVIFDSLGWLDPVGGMAAMSRVREDRPLVIDVCWRRLRGWRRILSQGLDPAFAPGTIETLGELTLDHGPHALTQAWLLVGWLACRLSWQPEGGKVQPGTELTWRFRSAHGPIRVTARRLPEGPPEILTLRAAPAAGQRAPALLFASEGGRLTVQNEGPTGGTRMLALPVPSRAAMVARQLSDLTPDAIFRDTFREACGMAMCLPH